MLWIVALSRLQIVVCIRFAVFESLFWDRFSKTVLLLWSTIENKCCNPEFVWEDHVVLKCLWQSYWTTIWAGCQWHISRLGLGWIKPLDWTNSLCAFEVICISIYYYVSTMFQGHILLTQVLKMNDPDIRELPVPSINGHATAANMAKLFGIIANGGKQVTMLQWNSRYLNDYVSSKEQKTTYKHHRDRLYNCCFKWCTYIVFFMGYIVPRLLIICLNISFTQYKL